MVFRCPCGTDPISRSPREQRPLSRTMLVLVAVSSINTNRAGLSIPCSLIQRRRPRATSGRSCSAARRLFFDSYIMSLEKSPDGGAAARDSALVHRGDHLIQGQIRLLGYQSQQPIRALLQRRRTLAARLAREHQSGRVFVRHIPNMPSGGKPTGIEIGAFLCERSYGPQHIELLRLIGTLVEKCPDPRGQRELRPPN